MWALIDLAKQQATEESDRAKLEAMRKILVEEFKTGVSDFLTPDKK